MKRNQIIQVALEHKIELYIPKKEYTDQLIEGALETTYTRKYGGCSRSEITGFYERSDNGMVDKEEIIILAVFVDSAKELEYFTKEAFWLKKLMKQESVMLTLDNKAYFV